MARNHGFSWAMAMTRRKVYVIGVSFFAFIDLALPGSVQTHQRATKEGRNSSSISMDKRDGVPMSRDLRPLLALSIDHSLDSTGLASEDHVPSSSS